MPTTRNRSWMRTRLSYMTSQHLTVEADLDYYLDQAEPIAISDWQTIDETLFRKARKTITTDSNGVATMNFLFTFILRMEDSNENKYPNIATADRLKHTTGYYLYGADTSTGARQVLIHKNGNPLANATLYVYTDEDVYTGSGASDIPILPYAYIDIIPMKAAELYFRDQGGPFISIADGKGQDYAQRIAQAATQYANVSDDPVYMENDYEPDAGHFPYAIS